jgi:hypothetical protein
VKRPFYIGALVAIAIAFFVGYELGEYAAEPGEITIPAEQFKQYSLLTWETRSRALCFSLMREYQRGRFIHSWTSKWGAKCGVAELKQALSALPKETYVYWNTWPPKNCDYPEDTVVREVVDFAATKNVHVQLAPALQ